ncbi:hypothetical protein VAE122_3110007 [Vibrio aestuarianus]|nr:hypothetical protein VAE122_3110007 [Vibrio aestuarianus]
MLGLRFVNITKQETKLNMVKKAHNKLFKSDSQRVAFSLCVGLSD